MPQLDGCMEMLGSGHTTRSSRPSAARLCWSATTLLLSVCSCLTNFLPQLPAWPFAAASVFLGAYALIPYMCLWSPPRNPEKLPLPPSELVSSSSSNSNSCASHPHAAEHLGLALARQLYPTTSLVPSSAVTGRIQRTWRQRL